MQNDGLERNDPENKSWYPRYYVCVCVKLKWEAMCVISHVHLSGVSEVGLGDNSITIIIAIKFSSKTI